ncbi:hypothetical protein FRB99_003250 [Tulasnella sp. 403]|nr:hypothetical protein FRB99_003250 [Tulasnella sp. 403]
MLGFSSYSKPKPKLYNLKRGMASDAALSYNTMLSSHRYGGHNRAAAEAEHAPRNSMSSQRPAVYEISYKQRNTQSPPPLGISKRPQETPPPFMPPGTLNSKTQSPSYRPYYKQDEPPPRRKRTQSVSQDEAPDHDFLKKITKAPYAPVQGPTAPNFRPSRGHYHTTSRYYDVTEDGPTVIKFYERGQPYFNFTNFSPHPVEYRGKTYPTSEHLFQALKFLDHRPQLAEHIRLASGSDRPRVAFNEARRFAPEVRKDWHSVNLQMMDMVLELKFKQHKSLKKELLSTGNAYLIEASLHI